MNANDQLEGLEQLEESLTRIFEYLHEAMVAELVRQGHAVTNQLIDSIKMQITKSTDFIRLDGMFVFYGAFVDRGRPAGIRKVPIQALIEWITQKGFEKDVKKIKGMAFAIQTSIFQKGISTPQSWRGEDTKNWMTKTLEDNQNRINDDVFNAVSSAMELTIFNIVNDTNTTIQGNTIKLSAA